MKRAMDCCNKNRLHNQDMQAGKRLSTTFIWAGPPNYDLLVGGAAD